MGDSPLIEEIKEHKLETKFQKARYIYYGERYYNSNSFVQGWYSFKTFFKLKSVEMGNFFSDRGHDLSRAGNNIKDSKFGEKVKKAGAVAKDGGKIVASIGKRTGKGAASLAVAGYEKTKDGAKAVANSYPVYFAEKSTKKGLSKAGAWIKQKASSFAGLFRKKKEKKEEMVELTALDENGKHIKTAEELKQEADAKKAAEEQAKKSTGKITLENQKAGHFKLAKDALAESFGRTGNDVKKLAEMGATEAKKKGTVLGNKIKGIATSCSNYVSDKFSLVKAKIEDHSYDSERKRALQKNQVKEMLRYDKAKVNNEYSNRMAEFREALKNDKVVGSNLKLRGDLERLRRNATAMENGNIGDFELPEKNSEGKFVREDPGQGMLQDINRLDLGKAAIEKVSIGDVKQEKEDLKLIKEQGLDPKNLPKTAVKENTAVSKGAEVAKGIQDKNKMIMNKVDTLDKYRGKVDTIRSNVSTVHDVTNVVVPILGGGEGYEEASKKVSNINDKVKGINSKVENNIKLVKNVGKGIDSVAALGEGVTGKKVVTAVADTGVAVEGIVDKAGYKVPLSGASTVLYNAMNIADDKERSKNIAGLVANGLQEAGAIMKYFGTENAFTNLSSVLNDNKFADRVDDTRKAFLEENQVKQAIEVVNDIKSGSEALKKVMDEYNIAKNNHTFLNQAKFLGPVVTILNAVEKAKQFDVVNDKIKSLTPEEKQLNITDTNINRLININADNIVEQNKDKKTGMIMDAGVQAAIDTVGIATGMSNVTNIVGAVLSKVSPTDLIKHEMKNKTDRELVFADAFGSEKRLQQYKKEFHVTDNEIETELIRLSNTSDVKEYASRVRAETALHLHAREVQAKEHGIENGATKLKGAAGIEGKSARKIYEEIGGRNDYDRTVGRKKVDMYEAAKQEKAKKGPAKNH